MARTMPLSGFLRNKLLTASLGLALALPLAAQRIVNISLGTSAGMVRVDFTVGKGLDCYGYRVLHSVDSTFFTVVEDYPGLCSNSTTDSPFSYTHTNPALNTVNYYKVELANIETSPIQRIYVPANQRPLLRAYPNPVKSNEERVYFKSSNTENGMMEGFLCDESGHKLRDLLVNSVDFEFELPLNNLQQGIYFVWLSDGVFVYGGKFLVEP